jgi:hypothetical protein
MNKTLRALIVLSFGAFWLLISLQIFGPAIDRIFAAHSDSFLIRFAALLTYAMCTSASLHACDNFVLGIHALWLKRRKRK